MPSRRRFLRTIAQATTGAYVAGKGFSAAARQAPARRQITIGSRVGDRYEVTAGLKAGERIISEGALFVQFAQTQ